MTLYDLKTEYMQLLEMMEDPEVDPEVLADTMEAVGGELADKADSYIIIIKELEADIEKRSKEIDRQKKAVDSETANIKRMKQAVMDAMQATGQKKLQTEHFSLSVVRNGGLQPLRLDDVGKIPEAYLVWKPEADTKKIRDALASGKQLDFAHLEERGTRLNVR